MKSTKKRICIPLRRMAAAWMLMTVVLCAPVIAKAATPLNSANFDSRTYADTYADLKAAFGYDHNMLWKHYQTYGANEQRRAYATNGDIGYLGTAQTPAAAGNAALNADNFDYRRYADTYADLKAAFGYDKAQLWNHYRTFGAREGRKVFTTGGATAVAAAAQPAANTAPPALVPLSELKQQPTFNRYMNDAEFEAAYAAAKPVVEQWLGLSKKDQVQAAARYVAGIPYQYSMSIKHYSDPYGLLVNRVASCAGHTRTVGFMLNMLGIPYQHMNEGQYSHQWVRVQIDGVWYCVDGQVGMMMAEPSPGWHPAMTGQTLYTDGKGNFWVR